MEFIALLEQEFLRNANPTIALQQKLYMRNKFEFFGIKTPERRVIQKPFLVKKYLPKKDKLYEIVKILWSKPQRDFHYFAQELISKYKLKNEDDIKLLEYIIVNQSWWDTVDYIASNLVAEFFKLFPELQNKYIDKWLKTENIWLQRTCLIYQLKYKDKLNEVILFKSIEYLHKSDDFFIKKAIGWSLRQYSRVNPQWVLELINTIALSKLSKQEALKLIK